MIIIDLGEIFITIILGLLTYFYDRGSRYSYLATRWNDLININANEPDFFNPETTKNYDSFAEDKKTIYSQHARMHWGFVEDVIRKDYFFERSPLVESFVEAYRDTIKDCIRLHHAWLKDYNKSLFSYPKFRKVLKKEFGEELEKVGIEL